MAAEDKAKKTKIDLKARLGRTTQVGIAPPPGAPPSSGAGPTPPPPSSEPGSRPSAPAAPASRPSQPAAPMGIAPPPNLGLSPGIPLPAFAPRPAPRAEPKPSAAQQTIKVEIGEEIHEERAKARRSAMLAAAAGAVIGIGIGFVAGGANEKGERAKSSARGAESVEKDVKAANEKLKELDAKLTEANDKLGRKEFPTDLSASLAGIVVPYDETILGKQVPLLLNRSVAMFFSRVKNLNDNRETLKKLADFAKDPVSKAFKEETTPVANFSVIIRGDGNHVVADLVPISSPFPWKGDWADKFKAGKPEKELKRYTKGDLSSGGDPQAIPVDPKSMANMTEGVALFGRLKVTLNDMRAELQGKDDPNAQPGLLKAGDDLDNDLRKAAANK